PITKPRPITNRIKDKFDQIKGLSLVKTPNSSPKIAGATDALGPSETVGVTKIAKTTNQLIAPKVVG
ncbi:hypothetical protein CKN54_05405, partial [Acinetobacter baumannii]